MRSAHVIPGEGPQVRYGVIPSEVEESSAVSQRRSQEGKLRDSSTARCALRSE
jgi:hypothetical protein